MTPHLDRETARALVEAGYMPLREYIAAFAPDRERARQPQHHAQRAPRHTSRGRPQRRHRKAA
jgi:hypothetical protein